MGSKRWVALVAVLVGVAGCQGGEGVRTSEGERIDVAATLAALDATFRDEVTADPEVRVPAEARCYLAGSPEDGTVEGTAVCGPVGVRAAEGPWVTYALELATDEGEVGLADVSLRDYGVEWTGEFVARPDALTPPGELYVAPPSERADAIVGLDPLPVVVEATFPASAFVHFPMWADEPDGDRVAASVAGVAVAPHVGEGYERLTAAEGYEFLVVDWTVDPELTEVALVVGGSRRSLDLDGDDFAVSVPEGTTDVLLEITHGGVLQTLSLEDGARGGRAPSLWYRDPTTAPLGQPYAGVVRFEDPGARGVVTSTDIRFTEASLRTHDGDGRPAPNGTVWLAVGWSGPALVHDGTAAIVTAWEPNASLELVDGTSAALDHVDDGYDRGELYFAVADDFQQGVLRLAPIVRWETSIYETTRASGEAPLDPLEIAIEIPLEIGAR
ncbi:hypothetical protein FTX61_06710 [Nitriliruptoraceae bacterium ZYF776]|nr:hypothetical protein [Profundirhabdus halotolerans]